MASFRSPPHNVPAARRFPFARNLTDTGRDEGATPAQIANQVIGTISRDAARTGAMALKDFLRGAVTGAAKGVTGRARA